MSEPTPEQQLEAVVKLVRGLIVAARTGPHGAGTRRDGHRPANCDSCRCIDDARAFVAAMTADEGKAAPAVVQ